MNLTLKVTVLLIGIVFVATLLYLLVKKRINERAALPWIAGAVIIIIFSILPNLLGVLARLTGVSYPPALLFLIAILVIILILLYQSIQISVLQAKCREMAQNLAIANSLNQLNTFQAIKGDKDE